MWEIHTRKNVLFYQDNRGEVHELILFKTDRKLRVNEAEEYLRNNVSNFKKLINVFFENEVLEIPKEDIKKYINIKGGNENE